MRINIVSKIVMSAAIILSAVVACGQSLEILNSSRSNLVLSLKIDEFALETSRQDGMEGQSIILNGIFLPNKAGMPDLPVISRYIAIPRGADLVLNILSQETETLSDVDLMPAPELPLDNDGAPMKYVRNDEVYSTDAFYPATPVVTSCPMKIRDVDAAIVSVTPFQYNPVTKELIVTKELKLEVIFNGGDGNFGGDPRYRSIAWDHIIRDMVINENVLPDADYHNFIREATQRRDTGCEYLIITPDNPEFIALADSIKLFRNQQGILTEVVTVSECGGNNQSAICAYIHNAYNNWDIPVSAVLLLSDHNDDGTKGIVSYSMNNHPGGNGYNPYISDNKYGDVNNDHLPEIILGRITGRNYEEMYHMINKDLQFERHPSTNFHFYDKPITAMGFQLERWFQLCSEIVNGFWEYGLGKHPVRINAIYEGTPGSLWSTYHNTNSIINYFGPSGLGYIPQNMSHLTDWNGTGNKINDAVNAGAFMIQHRDHGAEELWGEPSYGIGYINRLVNPDLTFVMSNNCLTGRFNFGGVNGQCFAEAFHRHQYGALGIIAATQVSYSFVNDVYVLGVYDNMWPDFMPDFGTQHPKDFILPAYANAAGKFFLQQSNWTDEGLKEITYYLFHHHGDAYMNLYSEMPENLDITVIPTVVEGATQFQITATENATICLSNGNDIIGLATATGQPQTMEIIPQTTGNELILTVTKQNCFRYTRKIAVIPNEGPYLIFNDFTTNNPDNNHQLFFNETASLDISIHNVGFDNIQNVNVELTSQSPYIEINSSSTTYESIDTEEIVTKNNAFNVSVSNDIPDQTKVWFHLTMSNGSYSYSDDFAIIANAPALKVTDMNITDVNGNPTDRLFKGETSHLIFTVNNQGHCRSNDITSHLVIDAPISYEEQTITTGSISANDSTDVIFIVTVPDDAPDGAIINDYMTVTSDGYQNVYQNTIFLGNCIEDFENESLNPYFTWSNSGASPWFKDNTNPYEGNYCFTGESSESGVTSRLILALTTEFDDKVSFYYRGSVNSDDEFKFTLDTDNHDLTGSQWNLFELPLKAGTHLLKWSFSRKSLADEGSASIDLIKLPPMPVEITDVDEITYDKSKIFVYPNPGNNEFNVIVSENDFSKLQIYDFQGRMILEKEINNEITTINTENLSIGLYFWKIGSETGKWIKSR